MPPNTSVVVVYTGRAIEHFRDGGDAGLVAIPLGQDLALFDATRSEPVPFDAMSLPWLERDTTAFRLSPRMPLRPNSRYELSDARDTSACDAGASCASARRVISSFTTGTQADDTPPTFAGIAELTTTRSICENGACCGPFDSVVASFKFAADPNPATIYGIKIDGVLQGFTFSPQPRFNVCATRPDPSHPELALGTYRGVAVDTAWNMAEPPVDKSLAAAVCAAGGGRDAGGSKDAGGAQEVGPLPGADGNDQPRDNRGCAFGGRGGTASPLLPTAMCALIALVRRMRKQASSGGR